jgi:hypothetical protein
MFGESLASPNVVFYNPNIYPESNGINPEERRKKPCYSPRKKKARV